MGGQFLCTANREEFIHPMAAALGDANDVTTLKNGLSRQRRLEKQTVKLAREYFKVNGNAPQLDWQSIAEKSPKVIEKLSAENISLPGEERHIPEDMFKDSEISTPTTEEITNTGSFFEESYQRYEFLLKQPEISDKDQQWINEYEKSSEWHAIYALAVGQILLENSWEKYEYLLNRNNLSERDQEWIHNYEDGKVFPGDYQWYKQKAVGDNQ
jgi:hypothetical protein